MARRSGGPAGFSRYYEMDPDDHLYFDIGNQAIGDSVSPRGAIHRAMIFTGGDDWRASSKGNWSNYRFLNFYSDLAFSILYSRGTGDSLVGP